MQDTSISDSAYFHQVYISVPLGVPCDGLASHPGGWGDRKGEVEIFQVTLCYRIRDKLRLDEPLGSYADSFTFLLRKGLV